MFLTGDKFRVKGSDLKGTVEKALANGFLVRWDSFPTRTYDYTLDAAKEMWEPDSNNLCQHELKEYVGFSESYIYCVRCGKK